MITQFKKGVLELIVLCSVSKKDMYGYELVNEVSKVADVNEGTIYPLLKRLTNDYLCDTYLVESNEGPPRKYYRITESGLKKKDTLLNEWRSFSDSVNNYFKEMITNE